MNSRTLVTMSEAAELVGESSGRKLFARLRDKKILNKQNIPYLRYREAGYFANKIKSHMRGNFEHQYSQTLVTEKGLSFISELLDEPDQEAPPVGRNHPTAADHKGKTETARPSTESSQGLG